MKQLMHSPFRGALEDLQEILGEAGIESEVKGMAGAEGGGIIADTQQIFELWVEDARFAEAEKLVQAAVGAGHEKGDDWKCPKCGEAIEGEFTDCWNCGTVKPGFEADAGEDPA